MYDSFYRVVENPFKICTDPRFLWCGENHSQILSNLIYGLMDRNGIVVLTGNIGAGKTTLVNALLNILGSDVYVAQINHPSLSAIEFLTLTAKGLDPGFTGSGKSDLLLFFDSFAREVHAKGKTVLLIVDEAQHLSMELLEEIRLLSNMEREGQRIFSIMLVGQHEFIPMMESPRNRSFYQRVTLCCEIQALSEKETPLYVEYRLKVSGRNEQLFTSRALRMAHALTKGNPRLINILCDRAMRIGHMHKRKNIDADIILESARDMRFGKPVKLKAIELLGLDILARRHELPTQLKNKLKSWSTITGHLLQRAGNRLLRQWNVAIPHIRSTGRVLMDKLSSICSRLNKKYHSKRGSHVWMAGVGLVAIIVAINAYKATQGNRYQEDAAVTPGAPAQWVVPDGSDNPQQVHSKKAQEDPTLLVSTTPGTSGRWWTEPMRQASVANKRPEPGNPDPASQPNTSESEPTTIQLAASALDHKEYQRAIELLESRRKAHAENNPKLVELYADALLGRALEIMSASPSKAEVMLQQAIDISPDNARAHLTLGKYRTRTKEYEEAITAYKNAIRLDPNLSDALFNLGFIYASTGKLEEAETAFSGAVRLKPPYLGKSLFNLAVVQEKLGKKEQCLANLEKAVAMMPQNEKASNYLNRLKYSATSDKRKQDR